MPRVRDRDELRSNFWRRKLRPAILERDNWTCHICLLPIERYVDDEGVARPRYKSPHPLSPSIDHTQGAATGMDQRYLKAAHLGCNVKRGEPGRADPKPRMVTQW